MNKSATRNRERERERAEKYRQESRRPPAPAEAGLVANEISTEDFLKKIGAGTNAISG